MATEVAFPNLTFDRPVALAYPEDGSNLLFVVEQHQARIWSFPNDRETERQGASSSSSPTRSTGATRRACSAWPSTRSTRRTASSSSTTRPTTARADPAAARSSRGSASRRTTRARPTRPARSAIWVSADDPFENHNGGCIAFGPDGFLYITLGDSGAADDPLTTGQNPRDWFGSILRIDVDHPADGKPYGIPADNPARGDSKASAHWAPEVYCIGLRNVWKFSFDRETGTLWAGDVGQNLWEMVHIIENGGNYGWSLREGFHPFRPRQKADPAAQALPADRRVPPQARPADRHGRPARASPAATSTAARPSRTWSASTSTATTTPAASGASARRTARPSRTAS